VFNVVLVHVWHQQSKVSSLQEQIEDVSLIKERANNLNAQVVVRDSIGVAEYEATKAMIDSVDSDTRKLNGFGGVAVQTSSDLNVDYWRAVNQRNLEASLRTQTVNDALAKINRQFEARSLNPSQSALLIKLQSAHQSAVSSNDPSAFAAVRGILAGINKFSSTNEGASLQEYLTELKNLATYRTEMDGAIDAKNVKRISSQTDFYEALSRYERQLRNDLNSAQVKDFGEILIFNLVLFGLMFLGFKRYKNANKEHDECIEDVRFEMDRIASNLKISQRSASEKTNFLAVISYEARTYLDSISGMSRLAMRGCENSDQEKKIQSVLDASGQFHDLLDDVLSFIDFDLNNVTLEESAFSFQRVLAKLRERFSAQADEQNILFEMDVDQSIGDIYIGDEARIMQMFTCLLGNCFRYTETGQVSVQLMLDTAPAFDVSRQRINVTIQDTGLALSKADVKNLFNPYSTTLFAASRRSGGGAVRLSIAKNVINLHDGEIEVENCRGSGVKITFYFNAELADQAVASAYVPDDEKTEKDDVNLQALNVLVVEDNETNSSLLRWLLEDLHHTVTIAENGVECLNLIEAHDYDLVFMDHHMPEMDGLEATNRIRDRKDHKSDVPIVGCTADAVQESQDVLYRAGQNDILLKPIDEQAVFDITQKLMRGDYAVDESTKSSF